MSTPSQKDASSLLQLKEYDNSLCIAVIGDMVKSRALAEKRAAAQDALGEILAGINDENHQSLLSLFTITLGDEFQGLLKSAIVIPDIIWKLETEFVPNFTDIRIGIGIGELYTSVQEESIGMDGPAWWAARAAIISAHDEKRLGGVFKNFNKNSNDDYLLNGYARLLNWHRKSLTSREREVFTHLRSGMSQQQTAIIMDVTKQYISKTALHKGWQAYHEGEDAWSSILAHYEFQA